jgi:hypothetical protein
MSTRLGSRDYDSSTSEPPTDPGPTPYAATATPALHVRFPFMPWMVLEERDLVAHLGLVMAPPSRSYSARSSPLLPSAGGRHTLEKTFLSSRVQSPSVLMCTLT